MGTTPAELGIQAVKQDEAILKACEWLVFDLNKIIAADLIGQGYTGPAFFTPEGEPNEQQVAKLKSRKKFYALDVGTSGAYLIEKETGEIFNIKGYGRPDYNKKRKSDIGNVLTCDSVKVFRMRHNYLR